MTLDKYLSNTQVLEQPSGLKEYKITPKPDRLFLCDYASDCGSKINGFCTSNVKYCNHRVTPQ